jgi:hypothetical protein
MLWDALNYQRNYLKEYQKYFGKVGWRKLKNTVLNEVNKQ